MQILCVLIYISFQFSRMDQSYFGCRLYRSSIKSLNSKNHVHFRVYSHLSIWFSQDIHDLYAATSIRHTKSTELVCLLSAFCWLSQECSNIPEFWESESSIARLLNLISFRCYNKFNCPRSLAAILNSSILCLIGYTITITVLVTNTQWERKPTIDEKTKL